MNTITEQILVEVLSSCGYEAAEASPLIQQDSAKTTTKNEGMQMNAEQLRHNKQQKGAGEGSGVSHRDFLSLSMAVAGMLESRARPWR